MEQSRQMRSDHRIRQKPDLALLSDLICLTAAEVLELVLICCLCNSPEDVLALQSTLQLRLLSTCFCNF